jgi:hypothetical protein
VATATRHRNTAATRLLDPGLVDLGRELRLRLLDDRHLAQARLHLGAEALLGARDLEVGPELVERARGVGRRRRRRGEVELHLARRGVSRRF